MKALRAVFAYELRAHLPFTAIFSISLLLLIAIHRVSTGSWDYWSSEWASAGLVASMSILSPCLLLFVALRLWAGEREQGTLSWLYSRPLSSSALFGSRVLAVATLWLLWVSIALVVHLPSSQARTTFLHGPPGSSVSPLVLWIVPGLVAFGLGAMSSCLSGSVVRALVLSFGLAAGILGLTAATTAALPTVPLLLSWGQDRLQSTAFLWAAWISFSCLIAAWVAVRVAPLDTRRIHHSWVTWSLVVAPGLIACALILLSPLRPDRSTVHQISLLGDGAQVRLCASQGIDHWNFGVPVVTELDGSEHRFRTITSTIFTEPQRGLLLFKALQHKGKEWQLASREGKILDWRAPSGNGDWRGLGWSPGGDCFAWTEDGWLHLMNDRSQVESFASPVPGSPVLGGWIDDRHIVLQSYAHRSEGPRTWAIVDRFGATVRAPEPLPADRFYVGSGARLAASVSEFALMAWQSSDTNDWLLVGANGPEWQLEPITTVAYPIVTSLGITDSGGLIWLERVERFSGALKVMRRHSDTDAIEELATVDAVPGRERGWPAVGHTVGHSGPWIVWAGRSRVVACNSETGKVLKYKLEADFWHGAVAVEGEWIHTPNQKLSLPPPSSPLHS